MTPAPLVSIATTVAPHESPARCVEAVQRLFPDALVEDVPDHPGFPNPVEGMDLIVEGVAPDTLIETAREQRILDTALDAMALNLNEGSTAFLLSRQAALSGKVAFVLPTEVTVGGVIEVTMEGEGLADWLEEVTWHPGRREVPRTVGDDVSMRVDGSVTEWFDAEGRPTIQTDSD